MTPHRHRPNLWLLAVMVVALIGVLLFTASCSPAKRLARLVKNHPELVKRDTIWRKDTMIIRERRVDTVFYFAQKDTVIKEMAGAVIKYYFNSSDSTVYLEGKCKGDTIIREIPVFVNTLTVDKNLKWYERLKLWLFDNGWWILLILYILYKVFGRVVKAKFPNLG